jgi:SAM-dependent methyltransferase
MINEKMYKIILSKPVKGVEYTRVEIVKNGEKYQASAYTARQVFHSNFDFAGMEGYVGGLLGASFLHFAAWDGEYEYSARVTKKGKVLTSRRKTGVQPSRGSFSAGGFNREKRHIIREGEDLPVLVDIGVFTKEGKVAAQMQDKFRQINRFLELLADETGDLKPGTQVNIIDFGCGKSYLTFVTYYYFSTMRGLAAKICGLDLNEDVIKTCTLSAEKYAYHGLTFKQGDIGGLDAPPVEGWGEAGSFNIVISLHACDTATDYALFNAVKWGADLICAVPCCQHELREQMQPKKLSLLAEYGLIKERIASLITDTIRTKLLEIHGYKSQIIEFTGMEHTPKNLFIRAKKVQKNSQKNNAKILSEIAEITHEFGVFPMLEKLLKDLQNIAFSV